MMATGGDKKHDRTSPKQTSRFDYQEHVPGALPFVTNKHRRYISTIVYVRCKSTRVPSTRPCERRASTPTFATMPMKPPSADAQRSVNKWTSRAIPAILIGLVGYATWVVLALIAGLSTLPACSVRPVRAGLTLRSSQSPHRFADWVHGCRHCDPCHIHLARVARCLSVLPSRASNLHRSWLRTKRRKRYLRNQRGDAIRRSVAREGIP